MIYTTGYEGLTLDGFVDRLKSNRIEVLVDVRLSPVSRKRGFSKSALRTAVEAAGIRYRHEKQLGNPTEFRRTATSTEQCLQLYAGHMKERWMQALEPLIGERGRRICLLCVERHSHECHRSIVARELEVIVGGPVRHL